VSGIKRLALGAMLAFVAALGGVYAGQALFHREQPSETELHALLNRQLDLDSAQHAKIEEIEGHFAIRRKALELKMRAANAHLAQAIEAEHGYGPEVTAAIDHTHQIMGELQKETLQHLFAIRAVLTPEQAAQFDEAVVKALAPPSR
jgi:Spy/CpxP family protein refolding chaperone